MKRMLLFILCAALLLMTCGCGDNNSAAGKQADSAYKAESTEAVNETENNGKAEKDKQIAGAKTAYETLLLSEEACCEVMDSIYAAWHFAIYEAYDYTNVTACFEAYIEATDLDYNSTLDLLNADLEDLGREVNGQTQLAYLSDIGTAVDLVIFAYYDNDVIPAIAKSLETAKQSLQSVTDQYATETGYAELKKYYVEIESYFEYIKNPTGAFDDLGTLVNTYETNMRTYRKNLEFIFG